MSAEHAVFDGARKIASDLSRGAYSSREIARAFISRIERFDSQINAVVVGRFDEDLKEADAADVARASGGMFGPLQGFPITIKDVSISPDFLRPTAISTVPIIKRVRT